MCRVVETEQEGEAAKVGAGDPAAHLIRRQSLKMWKDIEAGAMSSFMPKPKFSSAEPDLNEADWMDTDEKLSKSITKSVSGLVYEEVREKLRGAVCFRHFILTRRFACRRPEARSPSCRGRSLRNPPWF